MIVELPDHLANSLGRTVFTGLVKVEDDGRLLVMVPIVSTDDDDEPAWLAETLDGPDARRLAAELDVHGAGGGTA